MSPPIRLPHRLYRRFGKRLLDLALTVPALLVLALPGLALALAVRLRLGSPVLFRQQRPGLGGEVFTLLKLRTMTDATDAEGSLLPDAERLTPFGRFLRRTSLDELPELWNVLRGDMSLVGPRPLLVEYLEHYTPEQARRHEVRPGITGLAQVSGRNALSWEEKFARDVEYVDRLGPGLDLEILLRTLGQVFHGRGVSAPGHDTMPRFTGSPVAGGAGGAAGGATAPGRGAPGKDGGIGGDRRPSAGGSERERDGGATPPGGGR